MTKYNGFIEAQYAQIRARWNAICVSRPERAQAVVPVEEEGVAALAEAVQIGGRGEGGAQAEVLRFENEGLTGGIEEGFIRALPPYGEGEGVGGPGELEGGGVGAGGGV